MGCPSGAAGLEQQASTASEAAATAEARARAPDRSAMASQAAGGESAQKAQVLVARATMGRS